MATKTLNKIQLRGGTSTKIASSTVVLNEREVLLNITDTDILIGDGTTQVKNLKSLKAKLKEEINGNLISSITKSGTGEAGTTDTYTITYKDASTYVFQVKNGANGAAGGFGTPTATVDANVGTPSVSVSASGSNDAKVFNFAFKNLKGATGGKGDPGTNGTNGTSAYVHIRWGASATPSPLLTTPNTYIGIASTSSATAPTTYSGYTWYKYKGETGAPGSDGANGTNGKDGKGISSTTITYQAHTSGTTAPTDTWSASVPTITKGQYLWTRIVLTYSDSTTSTGYAVAYHGTNGTNGTNATVTKSAVEGVLTGNITSHNHSYNNLSDKPIIPTVPAYESSTDNLKANGTASVGSRNTIARGDHVHPKDSTKQDKLVSGTNIKSINGTSLLGSGDITISGGGGKSPYRYSHSVPMQSGTKVSLTSILNPLFIPGEPDYANAILVGNMGFYNGNTSTYLQGQSRQIGSTEYTPWTLYATTFDMVKINYDGEAPQLVILITTSNRIIEFFADYDTGTFPHQGTYVSSYGTIDVYTLDAN